MNEVNKNTCNIASRVICTEKLCETGVKEKRIFLPTIYGKLIAFICEKIQYCFSCNLIDAHIFFSFLSFLKSPNLIRIMTVFTKSRNVFKQTTLNSESPTNLIDC